MTSVDLINVGPIIPKVLSDIAISHVAGGLNKIT